mgnify:CR=1 FL=1
MLQFLPPWMVFDFKMMYAHFQKHGLRATADELWLVADGVLAETWPALTERLGDRWPAFVEAAMAATA